MKMVFAAAAVAFAAVVEGAGFEREAPEKYWDFSELCNVPKFRPSPYKESEQPGMRALLVEGKGPGNSTAEFFCYYAVPDGKMPEKGWPVVLLVHGGDGTAFPKYVNLWKRQGVAVVALNWYNEYTAPGRTDIPTNIRPVPSVPLKGGHRQDHVSIVANIVLLHTLMRSFPEIDKSHAVLVGLSWGSWYGACVTALDDRFKGCVELYCGDKDVNKDPVNGIYAFINGRFLHAAKVPMWWIVSANDQCGATPERSKAGFDECAKFDGCAIVNDLPHDHFGFGFEAVLRMGRYYAGLEKNRLPKLGEAKIDAGVLNARILDKGNGIAFAKIGYTTSSDPIAKNRKWHYAEAVIDGDVIRAKAPEGTRICYLAAYERKSKYNDMCGTTKYVMPLQVAQE